MEKDARSIRAACANFLTAVLVFGLFARLLKVFGLFCAILGIFANFAQFWAFFAHILCANFSVLKFCICYFVSFFHLWSQLDAISIHASINFQLCNCCRIQGKENISYKKKSRNLLQCLTVRKLIIHRWWYEICYYFCNFHDKILETQIIHASE